jgi:hypothetical protein
MKLALAVLVAVLAFALPAAADSSSSSTYDLYSTAGFDVNGEEINFSYSYQITLETIVVTINGTQDTEGFYLTSGLNYIVVDSEGIPWTLDYFDGGEFAVSNGPLQFATSLESCCNGIYIDQELYGPQGPTGQYLAQFWSATPAETPEPSLLPMLMAGILGLLAVNRRKRRSWIP